MNDDVTSQGASVPNQPLGAQLSTQDILDVLSFFDSWEERYKYIIDLGKALAPMLPEWKVDENLVRGCQSQVWLRAQADGGHLHFWVDSDAFIVKGLLAVVLSAYNGKTPEHILAFDIEAFFGQIDLMSHLSPTRGNGLRAMVGRVRKIAAAYQRVV